jgi:hypothetical protein
MPRPGIHLPLRNIPGSYPQQIVVASVPRIARLIVRVHGGVRHQDPDHRSHNHELCTLRFAPCDARACDLC